MFKTVECYKTVDGKIFEREDKAKEHTENLLGEELDGLFQLAGLDITRSEQFKALLKLLGQKKELTTLIDSIHAILHFGQDN